MALFRLIHVCILAILTVVSSSRLATIPTIPFQQQGNGFIPVTSLKSIIVDYAFADRVDEHGETLIPPSLTEFAHTFATDLDDVWEQDVIVVEGYKPKHGSIFLTIDEKALYYYESGEVSTEGYTLDISSCGVTIRGASPLGVWWGTRTLIQLAILSEGKLPLGTVTDSPGWKIRGTFIDAGRHYYPPDFFIEMCSYMSFFKQNTIHIHLSDNLFNNVDIYSRERSLELYARFRLWSDAPEVHGLNKFKNESYTEEQFRSIQYECAARGIVVIPEIEAPGHCLVVVQWKPELGLSNDLSLLNISQPEAIPTMKTIWGTFLGWFESKTVHIGADEYTGGADDYNLFVNEMAKFIRETSNKATRIWGTFPPKPTFDNITTDVSIQHWEHFEDNPLFDYIDNDYSVINSDDTFYIVNKFSESYPQSTNITKTFHGDPATGGAWAPNIFDAKNATNNPERTNPFIPGAIVALWNDFGANATVYSETYYALQQGIPALADKQWGGDLLEDEFAGVFSALLHYIPGQNLIRAIPSKTSTILQYSADIQRKGHLEKGVVLDGSGNYYDGYTDCALSSKYTLLLTPYCSLKTPLSSKGRDYTLTLRLFIDSIEGADGSNDATLILGRDSALLLTPTITLFASGNYYRLNSTVPLKTWVDLSISGRGNATFASVRETTLDESFPAPGSFAASEEEFLAVLGINGESFVWEPIAIEAPIAEIGGSNAGWQGELGGMILSSEA